MGTTYSIQILNKTNSKSNIKELKNKINNILKKVNNSLSHYIKNSDLNQLNNLKYKSIELNKDNFIEDYNNIGYKFSPLVKIIKYSDYLNQITNNYFNYKIGKIINIWGFGNNDAINIDSITKKNINQILKDISKSSIEIFYINNKRILKLNGSNNVKLNFASNAKGYAIDLIYNYLKFSKKVHNFYIEIGGEVRVSGLNKNNKKWKVAIYNPYKDIRFNNVISITDKCIATSGTYNNFFIKNNKVYSHLINPKTGYPVKTDKVSLSVIHNNCLVADTLATALFVMDKNQMISFIKKYKVPILILYFNKKVFKSKYFESYINSIK